MEAGGFRQVRRVRDHLALLAGALYRGVKLPPLRIVLLLGLLHMALAHVRNVEMFALLVPLWCWRRWHRSSRCQPARSARRARSLPSRAAGAGRRLDLVLSRLYRFAPPPSVAGRRRGGAEGAQFRARAQRLAFGGYLIGGNACFIDARAELYGEAFVMAYYRALQLKDVNLLLDLLKTYDIDAVLLTPATPAAGPA